MLSFMSSNVLKKTIAAKALLYCSKCESSMILSGLIFLKVGSALDLYITAHAGHVKGRRNFPPVFSLMSNYYSGRRQSYIMLNLP